MKNKKYFWYDMILSVIFFFIMGIFHNKFTLGSWILLAVAVEILIQLTGQVLFKMNKNGDE